MAAILACTDGILLRASNAEMSTTSTTAVESERLCYNILDNDTYSELIENSEKFEKRYLSNLHSGATLLSNAPWWGEIFMSISPVKPHRSPRGGSGAIH